MVGGGAVGARRALALAQAGGEVTVIAPDVCEDLTVGRDAGVLRIERRAFCPDDCDGAFLIVIATSDPAVNAAVAAAASERGVLCNDATCPEGGTAVVPSVVRRGDLVLAVTTCGASPALAARIRSELEEAYGPHYGALLEILGEARALARESIPDRGQRRTVLDALARDTELAALVRDGRLEEARSRARTCISSPSD